MLFLFSDRTYLEPIQQRSMVAIHVGLASMLLGALVALSSVGVVNAHAVSKQGNGMSCDEGAGLCVNLCTTPVAQHWSQASHIEIRTACTLGVPRKMLF